MSRDLVIGLGVAGRAVAEALQNRGIEPICFDDNMGDVQVAWAQARGLQVLPDQAALLRALQKVDRLFPTPGLPQSHPAIVAARSDNIAILSEFDLAAQWDDRPIVAVTGTDGKTTVCTMIEAMLNTSGIPAVACGNTDVPLITAIDDRRWKTLVVEASSFRLGYSQQFKPLIATWLNVGEDHLDTHRSFRAYVDAKAKIWASQPPFAYAVANRDDPIVHRRLSGATAGHRETFGLDRSLPHGVIDAQIFIDSEPLLTVDDLQRSLPHDVSNTIAAGLSAVRAGADRSAIASVAKNFAGLPHRTELLGASMGISYVNDSKATTPHATAAALAGYRSVVLLAGGSDKGLDLSPLLKFAASIRHVVALGDTAPKVLAAFTGVVPTTTAVDMNMALDQAEAVAKEGDVILLSPAFASFDWYRDFRARGDHFSKLVRERIGANRVEDYAGVSSRRSPGNDRKADGDTEAER